MEMQDGEWYMGNGLTAVSSEKSIVSRTKRLFSIHYLLFTIYFLLFTIHYSLVPNSEAFAPFIVGRAGSGTSVSCTAVDTASVSNQGTLYTINDVLTVSCATTNATFTVSQLGTPGGKVEGVTITNAGAGCTTGVKSTTGGTGSGCQINITALKCP